MEWNGYAAYRILIVIFMVTALIIEIPFELKGNDGKDYVWFTFATNWSLVLSTFTMIGFAVFSTYYTVMRGEHCSKGVMVYSFNEQ